MLKLSDYFLLARGLASVGEGEEAWRIVNALPVDSSSLSKADYYFTLSEMHVAGRDFEKACHMRDSFTKYQNKLINEIYHFNLENQLLHNEKALKRKSEELASAKSRENSYLVILLCLGIVSALAIVGYIVANYRKRMSKNREAFEIQMKAKENAIRELQASYDGVKHKNGCLVEEVESLRTQKSKVDEVVETLGKRLSATEESRQSREEENEGLRAELDDAVREKNRLESKLMEVLQNLDHVKELQLSQFLSFHSQVSGFCNSYPKGCGRREYELFEFRRTEYLSRYRDDKYMSELIGQIDYLMEGVIRILTTELKLTDASVKTVILDILGFDYTCIAYVLGVSPNAVSSRRARLKSSILSMPEDALAVCRRHIPMVKISS